MKKEIKESQTYRFRRQKSHRPQHHGPNPNLEREDSPSNSLGHKNTLPAGGQNNVSVRRCSIAANAETAIARLQERVLSLIALYKDNLFIVRRGVGPEDVVVHARFP